MARFYGEVGFGVTVETIPGITEDVITERKFRGDVLRDSARFVVGDDVNPDPTISNSISIVATKFAFANLKRIRYIKFEGELWEVNSLEVKKPRLIIGMGDIYNGPVPAAPGDP